MLRYALLLAVYTIPDICGGSPETVESLFLAWRLTGNEKYRNWAWQIFQAIELHCRVETGGYVTIINVDEVPSRQEDKMETFMMVCLRTHSILPLANRECQERNFEVSLSHFFRRERFTTGQCVCSFTSITNV
jgi:hypothetical protein